MNSKRAFGAFVVVLSTVGGCEKCSSCGPLKNPPDETVQARVKERVEKQSEPGTTLCGVPVKALRDVKIAADKHSLKLGGVGTVKVEGKPVPDSAAKIDPVKLALCSGVVMYTMKRGAGDAWTLDELKVQSVSTPGVQFTPQKSGDWD